MRGLRCAALIGPLVVLAACVARPPEPERLDLAEVRFDALARTKEAGVAVHKTSAQRPVATVTITRERTESLLRVAEPWAQPATLGADHDPCVSPAAPAIAGPAAAVDEHEHVRGSKDPFQVRAGIAVGIGGVGDIRSPRGPAKHVDVGRITNVTEEIGKKQSPDRVRGRRASKQRHIGLSVQAGPNAGRLPVLQRGQEILGT